MWLTSSHNVPISRGQPNSWPLVFGTGTLKVSFARSMDVGRQSCEKSRVQVRCRVLFSGVLGPDLGPAGEDGSDQASSGCKFATDDAPFGADGGDDVAQDSVDGVFVEDAQAAVGEEIHFQGFQFDAIFFGLVLDGDGAKVEQPGFGADGGVFGKARGDDIAGKLIRPGFDRGQFCVDAGA